MTRRLGSAFALVGLMYPNGVLTMHNHTDLEEFNHPFDEIVESCTRLLAAGNATFFQKYTCGNPDCRNRLTIERPNTLFTQGKCDECGYVTDIVKAGCNYMLLMGSNRNLDRIINSRR